MRLRSGVPNEALINFSLKVLEAKKSHILNGVMRHTQDIVIQA